MNSSHSPKIIAVAGGKGGVGKTVFACMLGMCLAGFKKRTILVDLDFSGANIKDYLNVPNTEKSLNTYFAGRSVNLTDIIQKTLFDKLDAITLQSEFVDKRSVQSWQKRQLLKDLHKLKADYIVLDLGAASSNVALDCFLSADFPILLSTNDMFSIVNAYSFIRSAVLRRFKRQFYDSPQILRLLDGCGLLVDGKSIKPLRSVMDQLEMQNNHKLVGLEHIWDFQPKVVLNFARENERFDDLFLLGPVTKDLLNVDLDYWGHIRFDDAVRSAVRSRRPDKFLGATGKASEDVVRFVVRNFIASEVRASDPKSATWIDKDVNLLSIFDEKDSMICTPNCLLWNSCELRSENGACSRMNLELVKKSDSS